MNLIKLIRCIFGKKLPLWSYGLDCKLCKKSFLTPRSHYNHVKNNLENLRKHKGKVPKLR